MASNRVVSKKAIIVPGELRAYLETKMRIAGLDVRGYAAKLGVSRQVLYMAMKDSRKPSPQLLQKMGLEVAYKINKGLFSREELKMLVVIRLQDSKKSPKDFAKAMDMHEQSLYNIMAGLRRVPDSLIDKLGVETVYKILPEGA